MALGLGASTIATAALWFISRRRWLVQASAFPWNMPTALRFGWAATLIPLTEAWILFMGGFFG